MSNECTFDTILHPWGTDPERGTVGVDTAARCGYFERKDGSEGGGLWFERLADGTLELVDYDGMACLPRSVVEALRGAGFVLDETFDA